MRRESRRGFGAILGTPVTGAEHALAFGEQGFRFQITLRLRNVQRFADSRAFMQDSFGRGNLRLRVEPSLDRRITQNVGD